MEGLLSDMGSERGTALCDQESLDSSPGRRSSGEGRAAPGRSGATQERAAAPQQANSRQFFVKHAMFSDADAGSLLIFDGSEGFAGPLVQSGDLTEAPVLQVRAPCNPWTAQPTPQTRGWPFPAHFSSNTRHVCGAGNIGRVIHFRAV